jgi:hypothetical protein
LYFAYRDKKVVGVFVRFSTTSMKLHSDLPVLQEHLRLVVRDF